MAQRYDKYKDSGVLPCFKGLKEIPAHWNIVPLRYLFYNLDYLRKPISANERPQSNPIYDYYGASGIIDKIDFYNVNETTLLIGEDGANLRMRNLPLVYKASGRYWVNNHAHILKPIKDDYNYLALLLESMDYNDYITGAAQPKLSQESLNKIRTILPPYEEQVKISLYLDDKCEKIDEWLSKKQNEVEHLGELKQRVIADAVTRGINPNVTMKQTNIPWLPEIPEHWEMSKVSSHFKLRNEKVSDKDYPALSVSKQGVTPQLDNVALSNAEGASRKLVKVGDYAVNSRSDRKGSCGISKYEGSVSLITIVLEPFDIDGEYVHYLFRSNPWVEEFYRNGRGIVADLWTTNFQMMKGMYFPVPPLEEQKQIVAYINDKTSKIDKLITNINKEIESIKEYKQRLVSDVVTGQIKVC